MKINGDKGTCLLPHPSHLRPSVPMGSTDNLIGPLHALESKLSDDPPAWNDPFCFMAHNCPPSSLVHIPTLWVYVLAQMPVISPFHSCDSFSPSAEKNGEKKGAHWEFQTLWLCSIHGSSDILLSSPFPPLLTDGSYQTVWKYCG